MTLIKIDNFSLLPKPGTASEWSNSLGKYFGDEIVQLTKSKNSCMRKKVPEEIVYEA